MMGSKNKDCGALPSILRFAFDSPILALRSDGGTPNQI